MKPVVAIDGPAGSGKGTLARMIASHFNFIYLDTGYLYRVFAYVDKPLLKMKSLSVSEILNIANKFTTEQLRSEENGVRASHIAQIAEVREIITNLQKEFIEIHSDKGIVLDGRDIGTVVVPDACCKLFITADLKERAKRRFNDLKDKNVTFSEVFNNMKIRDVQDKSRAIAPLIYNESYTLIDTTKHSVDESFKVCKEAVKQAFMRSEFKELV